MKPFERKRRKKATERLRKKREKKEETTATARPPEFDPTADSDKAKADKKVAKLKIHSDTETANRSKLTMGELMQARVGHSWVSLEYPDKTDIPDHLPDPAKTLINYDLGSWGFWPLLNRSGAAEFMEHEQERVDIGVTPGAGGSDNMSHTGFSLNPFKWVPGRVEEPDNAHAPKGTKEYEINQGQVDSFLKYVEGNKNHDYNLYKYNCTTFAVKAVEAAGEDAPSGSTMGVCLPNKLYKQMYHMSEKGDANVKLAPLAEGETHGKAPKKRKNKK